MKYTPDFDFDSLPILDADPSGISPSTEAAPMPGADGQVALAQNASTPDFDFDSLPVLEESVAQIQTMSPKDFKGQPNMGGATEQALMAQAQGGPVAEKDDGSISSWLKNAWNAFAHNASGRIASSDINWKTQRVMEGVAEKEGGKRVSFLDLPDAELDDYMNSIAPNGFWGYVGNAIGMGGRNDLMKEWDETQGAKIADPAERKKARVQYAMDVAKGVFQQTEEQKQLAQAELQGRGRQWQSGITGGAIQMAGYMAPALAPVVGMPLSAAVEGTARRNELLSDKYETDAEGNVHKVAQGDTRGSALVRGAIGGTVQAAVENYAGKVAGKIIGKIPGAAKVGDKVMSTAIGKAVGKFYRPFGKFFEKTGLDDAPSEFLEEFAQTAIDSTFGLDRRQSEMPDGMVSLERGLDATVDLVKNSGNLLESMLLVQLAGGGLAHMKNRLDANRILRDVVKVDPRQIKGYSTETKWRLIDNHFNGMSEEQKVKVLEAGAKEADNLLHTIEKERLDSFEGRLQTVQAHKDAAKRIYEAREQGKDVSRRMLQEMGIDTELYPTVAERNALADQFLEDRTTYKMRQEAEAAIRRTKMDEVQRGALADEITALGIDAESKEYGGIWLNVANQISDAKELDDPVRRAELVQNALEKYVKENGELNVQFTTDDGATHERSWTYNPPKKETTNETRTDEAPAQPISEQSASAVQEGQTPVAVPQGAQSAEADGVVAPPKNVDEARKYFTANVGKRFSDELGRTVELAGLSEDGKQVHLKVTLEDGNVEDVDMSVRAVGANIFANTPKWKPVAETPVEAPASAPSAEGAITQPKATESAEGGISQSDGTITPEEAAKERKKGKRIPKTAVKTEGTAPVAPTAATPTSVKEGSGAQSPSVAPKAKENATKSNHPWTVVTENGMEKVKFSSVPDRSLTSALKGAGFKYDGKSRTWSKPIGGEGAEKVLSSEYDSFESVYTRKLHEAAKEKNKQRQLKLFDGLDKYVASVARIDANDPEETIARISDAFDSSIKRMKTDQMGVSNLTRLSDALVKQISQISDAEVAKMYNALVASKAEVYSTTNPAYHLMRALQSAAQSRGIDLYAKIAPTKEEEQARKKGKKVPPKKEAKPRTYTKEEMGRAYKAVMSEDYAKKNPKDAELAAEMLKSGLPVSSIDARDFTKDDLASWPVTGLRVNTREDAANLCRMLSNPYFEVSKLLFVDKDGKVLSGVITDIGLGGSTKIEYSGLEKYIPKGAYGVIASHNHPLGSVAPSSADRSVIPRQKAAWGKVGIKFLDHIITDTTDFYSMTMGNHGMVPFGTENGVGEWWGESEKRGNSVAQAKEKFATVDADSIAYALKDGELTGSLGVVARMVGTHDKQGSYMIGMGSDGRIVGIVKVNDKNISTSISALKGCERIILLAGEKPFDRKSFWNAFREDDTSTKGVDRSLWGVYSLADGEAIKKPDNYDHMYWFVFEVEDKDIFKKSPKRTKDPKPPKLTDELKKRGIQAARILGVESGMDVPELEKTLKQVSKLDSPAAKRKAQALRDLIEYRKAVGQNTDPQNEESSGGKWRGESILSQNNMEDNAAPDGIRPADFAMADPKRAASAIRQKLPNVDEEAADPMNASLNPNALKDPSFVEWAKKKGRAITAKNRRAYDAEQVKAAVPILRRVFPGLKVTYHDTVQDPNAWHANHPNGIQRMESLEDKPKYQREYDEVYNRYHNADGTLKAGWMKAPNGKPTNLTERQWVQVRTPSFKKWFGDWELLSIKQGWMDVRDPEEIKNLQAQDISAFQPIKDKSELVDLFKGFGEVKNASDGRIVRFPSKSAGKMIFKKNHASAFKMLFEGSLQIFVENETKYDGHKEHPNVKAYRHYVNKFTDGNGTYYIRFTVRDDSNGSLVHGAEISDIEIYNENGATQFGNQTDGKPHSNNGNKPFIDNKIAYYLSEVNPSSVSKVVDENGEPLVVWHATNDSFTEFKREKLGVFTEANGGNVDLAKVGFWFNNNDLSKKLFTENSIPVFLNIKNPSTTSFEDMYDGSRDEAADGYIVDDSELGGTSYVALDSTQIKSATDNTGAFDGTNPDIRYLIDQKSGRTLGWFSPDMKEVHLNPGATVETLAHEVLHAAQDWAKKNNPKLAAALEKIAKECPRDLKQKIIRTYKTADADTLLKEWGAFNFMGEGGKALRAELAKRENASWLKKFWNAVKDIWKDMMAKMGFNRMDLSAIDSMSANDAMAYLARGMASGMTIGKVDAKNKPPTAKIDMTQKPSKMEWYKTTAFDYRAPLKWLRDEMAKRGVQFSDDSDFYQAARLVVGENQRAFNEAQRRMADYQKMLDDSGIDHSDIVWYMQCLAAKDRNAMIKERNGKENGSGISDREAAEEIARMESEPNGAKYREIAQFLQKMQREGLQFRVDSGLLDAETAQLWLEREPNHVPFRSAVDTESGEHIDWGNTQGQFNKKEFITAKGRQTFADDVVAWMFQEYLDAYTRGNENKLRGMIAEAIEISPSLGVGKVRKGMEKTYEFDYSAGPYKTTSDGNGVTGDKAKKALVNDPDYRESRKNNDGGKRNVLAFKRGGKAYFIEFSEGEMGDKLQAAVNGRDLKKMPNAWNKLMRGWAATATSLSPTFAIRNGVADSIDLYGNYVGDNGIVGGSKAYGNHLKNVKALSKAIHKYIRTGKIPDGEMGKWIDRYEKAGGLIAGMKREGYEDMSKRLALEFKGKKNTAAVVGSAIMNGIDYMNRFSELANRLAAFKTQVEMGKTDKQAALWSRESTVDFNMKGNVTGITNALWMFSNSTLGASARQIRALYKSKHNIQLAIGLAALGFLGSIAEWALNYNDEDEREEKGEGTGKDVSEYTRANSMSMRVGGTVLRLPFHAGPFSLVKYAGDCFGRFLTGQMSFTEMSKALGKEGLGALLNFLPFGNINFDSQSDGFANDAKTAIGTAVPSIFQPFVQGAFNMDYAGRSIYNEAFSNDETPRSEQGRKGTASVWKWAAEALNEATREDGHLKGYVDLTPEVVKLAGESIGKNALRDVMGVVSVVNMALQNEDWDVRNIPVARDFVRTTGGNDSRFYEARNEYRDNVNAYKKGNMTQTEKSAYLKRFPHVNNDWFKDADTQIRRYRKQEDGYAFDKGKAVPYEWSKEQIEEFREERLKLQAEFIKRMGR